MVDGLLDLFCQPMYRQCAYTNYPIYYVTTCKWLTRINLLGWAICERFAVNGKGLEGIWHISVGAWARRAMGRCRSGWGS